MGNFSIIYNEVMHTPVIWTVLSIAQRKHTSLKFHSINMVYYMTTGYSEIEYMYFSKPVYFLSLWGGHFSSNSYHFFPSSRQTDGHVFMSRSGLTKFCQFIWVSLSCRARSYRHQQKPSSWWAGRGDRWHLLSTSSHDITSENGTL